MQLGEKLVAPDGGWGWMVVLGMAISSLITVPILQNFGLLFRDVLVSEPLYFTLQQVSIIMNTNSSFGYILGLFNGPILRNLGFRKVAIAGGLMMFVGLLMTSFSYNFYMFLIFYGLLHSLGVGWSMASYHLALATYFVKRRGMAMGIAMTFTGLGPVIMPLFISFLMMHHGARGATLILSGVLLNCVWCGMLLQPVKWHRKRITIIPPVDDGPDKTDEEKSMLNGDSSTNARGSKTFMSEVKGGKDKENKEIEMTDSIEMIDIQEATTLPDSETKKKNKESNRGICDIDLKRMFDLDLLVDPVFLSMCIGMSLALASDMNFSILLPFILGDMGFDTEPTAQLIAVVGIADILSRFLMPFLFRKTQKLSARLAYLFSLIGLMFSRFWLTLTSQFMGVLLVVALFGASKGVRSVFMPLVVPNYVPLEKLPSALGVQNLMHGVFLMLMGPLIGFVRDKTGNYILCIHIMNCMTALTILLWTVEFLYMRSKKRNTFVDVVDAER